LPQTFPGNVQQQLFTELTWHRTGVNHALQSPLQLFEFHGLQPLDFCLRRFEVDRLLGFDNLSLFLLPFTPREILATT
jgi:hypothetical protein